MSRILSSCPKEGQRIGLAFSGGLDTRAAVAWLARRGLNVHCYTADLAQPDEDDVSVVPDMALEHGATVAKLLDCRQQLVREGIIAVACGAFHVATAGKTYFNTTPLGRAVTATEIVRAMRSEDVNIFGDGSTHKGNDIQRFYRYGLLENPELLIYKPWLDEAFTSDLGGRAEMSRYLESIGKPYKVNEEQAYSTDANCLGATHEAKDLESLSVGIAAVNPIMGVRSWDSSISIDPEVVSVSFDRGVPVCLNGEAYSDQVEFLLKCNEVAGRHGLGMSDQIENRVIGAKSRGIYEAPGMALLHLAYERLISAIHNEQTMSLYRDLGRRLGGFLYEGRWFDPESRMLQGALLDWVATPISGEVTVELRRGDDWSFLDTEADYMAYDPSALSMERISSAVFTPRDRIGALAMLDLGVLSSRALLERHSSISNG